MDGNLHVTRSIALTRSQEPLSSEDLMVNEQMQKTTKTLRGLESWFGLTLKDLTFDLKLDLKT